MDWLDFFSSVIGSLAWPLAMVILIFILRGPIRELIPNLERLRFRDLELSFRHKIEETEQQIEEAKLPASVVIDAVDTQLGIDVDKIDYLIRSYPRGAILESWLLVESEFYRTASRFDLPEPARISLRRIIDVLRSRNRVSKSVETISNNLRMIRNNAVHLNDFSITSEDAKNYHDMAMRVVAALRQA